MSHRTVLIALLAMTLTFIMYNLFSDNKRVSVAILWAGDEFLIVRNARGGFDGFWGLPGGKTELFESGASAASREIFEETGLTIKPIDFKYITNYFVDHSYFIRKGPAKFKISLFEHRLKEKPEVVLNLNEHSNYRWIKLKEIDRFPLIPGGDNIIRSIYCEKSVPGYRPWLAGGDCGPH